jgi:hypothetical protein
MMMSGWRHTPAGFSPGKEPKVAFEARWVPESSIRCREEKNLHPRRELNLISPSSNTEPSYYADYASRNILQLQ